MFESFYIARVVLYSMFLRLAIISQSFYRQSYAQNWIPAALSDIIEREILNLPFEG